MEIYRRPIGVWLIGLFILLGTVDAVLLLATEPSEYLVIWAGLVVSVALGLGILLLQQWAALIVLFASGLAALWGVWNLMLVIGMSKMWASDLEDDAELLWQAAAAIVVCFSITFYLSRKSVRTYFTDNKSV
jgi:hypothetical protein